MTREEAILKIEYIRDGNDFTPTDAQVKAMNMAIEALSAEAVQGEWVLVKGSNGKEYHKCSKCLHTQEITGVKNYCAVCGAKMNGERREP